MARHGHVIKLTEHHQTHVLGPPALWRTITMEGSMAYYAITYVGVLLSIW